MKLVTNETKNNTSHVDIILTEPEVLIEKEHAIDELIKSVTVKGFRQGKAPKAIAKDHIDPDKLSNQILNHVLNHAVSEALKENKFRLLGRPVLENIDSKNNDGWIIKISLPLYPEIKVGDYKKLFTKATKTKTKKEESEEAKIEKIYQTLLDNIKISIPESVIEEETNYSLEKLEKQAKTLNLTLENYLKAVKKTLEEVKAEYAKRAEESIKLDLILLEIAKQEKINTSIEEVNKVAKAGGIEENQIGQLKAILDRRKTIELLLKLC
ncbi:MAG TPA: trigger factor [Spirochaetia bacterium]|nr:trigger factor [Spirochaetia bacterium]